MISTSARFFALGRQQQLSKAAAASSSSAVRAALVRGQHSGAAAAAASDLKDKKIGLIGMGRVGEWLPDRPSLRAWKSVDRLFDNP